MSITVASNLDFTDAGPWQVISNYVTRPTQSLREAVIKAHSLKMDGAKPSAIVKVPDGDISIDCKEMECLWRQLTQL